MAISSRPALAGGVFRTVLAGLLLGTALFLFPNSAAYRAVPTAYFAWTLVNLVLIHRKLWPKVRVPVGGLVDYAIVTIIVHQLGSVRTVMVLVYFVSGTLYALAVPFSTAIFIAGAGSTLYAVVVALERLGILEFRAALR